MFCIFEARLGNLADVSAKDGSQETLVNLAALITSIWLLPLLDGSSMYAIYFLNILLQFTLFPCILFRMTWTAFMIFTLLHIFANLKAVKAVTMQTLNRTRFLIILKQYASTLNIPSVKEVNLLEPVVMGLIPTGITVFIFSV